jgi:hypothetical protein
MIRLNIDPIANAPRTTRVVDLRTGRVYPPTPIGARLAWSDDREQVNEEWMTMGVVRAWWRKHREMIRRRVGP